VNVNAPAVEDILTANPDVLKAVFSYTLPGDDDITEGLTPLKLAAALGKDTVAEFILEKGSDYLAETDQKIRAFLLAVSRDHAEIAKVMLEGEGGLDLLELRNEQDETPLLVAARNGAHVMVGVLLKYGANFTVKNSNDDTAIHVASRAGHFRVVWMIFHERGSDILELEGNNKQTPLLAAAANGKTDIFHFLLDKGAYDGALDEDDNAAIHLASKFGHSQVVEIIFKARGTKCLELRGDYERTPLLAAAANGKVEVVKFLLDKGADIWAQDRGTYDAIHRASQFGHLAVIEKLYEAAGTKILEVRGKYQQTPLLTAAVNGKIEIVQFLLDKGASIMARDRYENTALHLASWGESIGIVKLILEKEPDLLDLRNEHEETALLSVASRQAGFEILKYLHSKGADITAEDIFGRTVMYKAAQLDDPSIVKYLLDAGEDPTRTTYYGNNALHIACACKRAQVVGILLDGPANFLKTAIASENEERDTPLCIAILSNEASIILRLLQSTVYYPVSPTQDDVYIACLREIDIVYKWLLNWVEHFPDRHEHDQHSMGDVRDSKQNERGQETSNDKDPNSHDVKHLNTVIYWALLNDKGDLIELAMKKGRNPAPNQEGGRKGVTWLHVAALGGHVNLLEKVPNWRDSIKAEATKKITPLHLAAKQGNYDMVWKLLECLESENIDNKESPTTGRQRVLRAIVQGTEDAESLISLAAARKDSREHMRLERSLWDKLFEIIKGDWNFFEVPHTDDAELVMGVAAWCHTAGEKEYFYKLMSIVDGTKWRDFKLFPLQLTVQHQFPVALWWLLSSGRNFGEKPIREGEAMMRYWRRPKSDKERLVHGLIEELLTNPPPVRPPLKDDKRPPHFQYERPEGDLQKGAVLDLFVTNKRDIIIEFKRSSMVDIIYDKGPNEIMRNDGYRNFQAFKKRLFSQSDDLNKQHFESGEPGLNSQLLAEESPHIGSKKSEGESKKKSGKGDTSELGSRERRSRYRWIHIPVNNVSLMGRVLYITKIDC
jgi:ankyrin repeat protein